jgi:hypothetical protein
MNASYPSFQNENANRAFPFVFNHHSSGIKNSWISGLKGFTRKSLVDNVNLYKIFVYPTSANQLTGTFLNDENIDYQNNGFIENGYVSLLIETHKGATILDRTVALKIPINNDTWPYTAVASKIEDGIKIYEIRALISKDIFTDNNLNNFLSINSVLYVEPSLISSIGNVVVDKLSVIKPEQTQSTGNILVTSSDSRVAGKYILSESFNNKPQYFGPRDFCIRWKDNGVARWSLSKKTIEGDDFYFSTENVINPLSVSSWSRGPSGIQGASISFSGEVVSFKRNVLGDVLFSTGINTEVLQTDDDIILRSEVGYGLGQSIYTGTDSGICNGIININGVRPQNSRTFTLSGGDGIIVEDRPTINDQIQPNSILIKLDPVSKAAKCPPFLKITDASLLIDNENTESISYYASFNVILSSTWPNPIAVNYQTVGDTAISNVHFEEKSGSLILGSSQKNAEIRVPVFLENFPANQYLTFSVEIDSISGVSISNNTGEAQFRRFIAITPSGE